uniref:NADH dehydrogenase [ubiquinone] 1 beta subcomplex subunit 2, mitochondrial n=1 Tax=Bos taurus TaxID=9913 RepID=A0AAA9TPN1_BOVIN
MAGMSALKRLAPFAHVGGHLFRGRCARAAGARGVRRAGGGAHIEPRYRQFPQLTRSQVIQAEFFSATMWFWILWRFWHDSDAVLNCCALVPQKEAAWRLWTGSTQTPLSHCGSAVRSVCGCLAGDDGRPWMRIKAE